MIATYSFVADVYNKYKYIYDEFAKMPVLIPGSNLPGQHDSESIVIRLGKIANGVGGCAGCCFDADEGTVGGLFIKINDKVDFELPQLMNTILHEMVHICEYIEFRDSGRPSKNYDWHGKYFRYIADRVEQVTGYEITELIDTEMQYFTPTLINDYIGLIIMPSGVKHVMHVTPQSYKRMKDTTFGGRIDGIVWYKSKTAGLPYGLTCMKCATPAIPYIYKYNDDVEKAISMLEEL